MMKKGYWTMGVVDHNKNFVGFLHSKFNIFKLARTDIKNKARNLGLYTVGVVFKRGV